MACNKTLTSSDLMRIIGIPGIYDPELSRLGNDDFLTYMKLAEKNKIPLLFLRTIESKLNEGPLHSRFLKYESKYQSTMDLIKFVSSTLSGINVRYTLFKTVKPFPYVPSDVDVLLFSNSDLKLVVKELKQKGCSILDHDVYGATLFSPTHNLNIDLTTQVAVSGMVYVDKKLLFCHVADTIYDGDVVKTLEPPVDLLTVIAHSVFKEQLFTLSDYYALVLMLKYWNKALKTSKVFHLEHALGTVLNLTCQVTLDAFGSLPPLMKQFFEINNPSNVLRSGLNFSLPKKYDVPLLVSEFSKKVTSDMATMKSMPLFLQSFCNISFYKKFLDHATRKKY